MDRRQNNKSQDKESSPRVKPEDYKCPLCNLTAGHPRPPSSFRKLTGFQSLARCPDLLQASQSQKLAKVQKASSCTMCMSTWHGQAGCNFSPDSTTWLAEQYHGSGCNSWRTHCPRLCPKLSKEQVENLKKTCTKHTVLQTDGTTGASDIIFNLIDCLTVKTEASPPVETICQFDCASDSSWLSSDLARSLSSQGTDVSFTLSTMSGLEELHTIRHHIQIFQDGTYHPLTVYEMPTLHDVQYPAGAKAQVEKIIGCPVFLPTGDIGLLLGNRQIKFFPTSLPASTDINMDGHLQNIRLYDSNHSNGVLVNGVITAGDGPQLEDTEDMFSTSEYMQKMRNVMEAPLDCPPPRCTLCHERSKSCPDCSSLLKPVSWQTQKELKIIKANIFFSREKKSVEIVYKPMWNEEWKQIFPPWLSNHQQAKKITMSLKKSLEKDNTLADFDEAFKKYEKREIVIELTQKMKDNWEEEGGPINYISLGCVKKFHQQKNKQSTRVVTNSSLNRKAIVNGQEREKVSLNSCLPAGAPAFNPLTNVHMGWRTGNTSLLLDLEKAYSNLSSPDSYDGRCNQHLRRLFWYKDPFKDHEPTEYLISPCHYGDASAAAFLQELIERVASDMLEEGKVEESKIFLRSNFVDDFLASLPTPERAFQVYEIFKEHLQRYGVRLHEAIVTNEHGRWYEPAGPPVQQPRDGDPLEDKILGIYYHHFNDTFTVPIEKAINEKKRGARIGVPLTPEQAETLQGLTLRKVCSWQASLFDPMGHLAPLLIKGKVLLSRIQSRIPPVNRQAWDQHLPPDLEEEAREYFKLIASAEAPTIKRAPPQGSLEELNVFHDGSSVAYAIVVYAVFVSTEGRHGNFLYCQSRTASRSVPDNELSSLLAATTAAKAIKTALKEHPITRVNLFGDSECTMKMMGSEVVKLDVFKANRRHTATANLKDLTDDKITVQLLQVPSAENLADPASKPLPEAASFIHTNIWKHGPAWLSEHDSLWPATHRYLFKDKVVIADEEATKTVMATTIRTSPPIFTEMLKRTSHIRLAKRIVARVGSAVKRMTLKAIKLDPSLAEEDLAFRLLLKDQQQVMKIPDNLQPFNSEGLICTTQRWAAQTHLDLFGRSSLFVVQTESPLGSLLLAEAHRSQGGGCRSTQGAMAHYKLIHHCQLTGGEQRALASIRANCTRCRRKGIRSGHGASSPAMEPDRFKEAGAPAFSRVSCDHIGPIKVSVLPAGASTRRCKYAEHYVCVFCCTAGSGAVAFYQVSNTSSDAFKEALALHQARWNV